ncbi:adenosylcobinamide-phosphate synthase CbiB [Leptospira sp. WS58.C1]|uniref:adenosylcobinamide-phosphate synthase CbiB n=1 Tax=Leptospira TaxID=171 RepID=UPI0002BE3584|nr:MULTISPECIES: adenosylcobinamide-phosphate synthase CbiB [unclassified Leptospira]EMK01752.1 cobalamin biosynthesis protein CobD [Leptospira sp. B5-022]MCR1795162.1 adenosylcobinamide-phosphate synthase CbiB [Leptospira sp. id769339]
MTSIWIIPASLLLDLGLGDPQGSPHPVRLIGKFARYMEKVTRKYIVSEKIAGIMTAFSVYSISFIFPWIIIFIFRYIHPFLAELASAFIIYTSIALKDLLDHSKDVYSALCEKDLDKARFMVARIVGRDTENLEEPEIVRAGLESVGESLVDGITAPLFFAAIGGPSLAMLYRSINTLDSLFGYKNQAYLNFGWISARMDDLANYIPARLTAPILCISSAILGFYPLRSFKILIRDGRKHPSPNSGLCEAALAGALKIQLGGRNYYSGVPSDKPKLGDPDRKLVPNLILDANKIIFLTSIFSSGLFLCLGLAAQLLYGKFFQS